MRISECTAADNDSLRYIIFVSTEGALCFLKEIFTRVFAPALLADVVWALASSATGSFPTWFYVSGTRTGKLAPFLKRRESIAQKNIELCFPDPSREESGKTIAVRISTLGMALLRKRHGLVLPDSRVRKWFDVDGLDNLTSVRRRKIAA